MAKPTRRQDLIAAIKKGKLPPSLLQSLTDDEMIFAELFTVFPMAGSELMADAPSALVARAYDIPATSSVKKRLQSLVASLVSDSWSQPQPAGVRGVSGTEHRSLHFRTDAAQVLLRAEKHRGEWHIIVELSESGLPSSFCRVEVGHRTVEKSESGLFEWSSKRPPGNVVFHCEDGSVIQLPEISWKRPK